MDIEEAEKIINKRTERLLEEFKIEKEVEPQDEPKIAYLMQEIRANKTILSELDKDNNIISDLQNEVTLKQSELDKKDKIKDKLAFALADYVMYYEYDKCRNPEMIKNKAKEQIEYFTNKVEEDK